MGPVTNHVALLGDGNRRWAKQRDQKVWLGHDVGLRNYIKMTKFLKQMGCPEVTLFLYSIDNKARKEDEHSELIRLIAEAIDLFTALSDELEMRVRIVGEKTFLPQTMQDQISRTEDSTRKQTKFTLNLAIAYSSRFDITNAIKRSLAIGLTDISADLLRDQLVTAVCPEVDLLIRTSGETRLSDFFLWEVSLI